MSTEISRQRGARPLMPQETRPKNARLIDPMAPRYAFLALHAIDLRFFSGVNFVGVYQDAEGREAIPAKQLVQFVPQMAFTHNEVPAVALEADQIDIPVMDGYETQMLSQKPRASYRSTRISPARIAYMLMRENERRGMALFEEVAGLSWNEVEAIFDAILLRDAPELEPTFRMVGERRFPTVGTDVFLYQIRNFLQVYQERDMLAHLPRDANASYARHILKEIRAAVGRGWSYANATLNATEANIRKFRNGHKGKEGYDAGDERYADAPPPQDLLFLAETNRTPIDQQELQAAKILTEQSESAVVKGMERIGKQIAESVTSTREPVLTRDEVEQMMAERDAQRDEEWLERIAELKARDSADSSEPIAAISSLADEPATEQAGTGREEPATAAENPDAPLEMEV